MRTLADILLSAVSTARRIYLLQDLLGVQLQAGSSASFVTTCHKPLAGVETRLKAALVKVRVLHQDETGWQVGTPGWWVHTAEGVARFCRIRSYLSTLQKQGIEL